MEHCQRKLRHTTHHQDLPQKVTVTRVRHPFEGKSLAVWQSIRRKGRMYLVLILPDGSKSMIPAEWTDFGLPAQHAAAPYAPTPPTMGSLEDLLHARAVVDALLSRHAAVPNREAAKESLIAKQKSEPVRSAPRRNLPLGNIARAVQAARDRNSGTTHR